MADYIDELYKKCFKTYNDMLASNTNLDLNKKRSEIVDQLPENMANDFWEILILDSSSSFRCGFLAALMPAIQIVMKQ